MNVGRGVRRTVTMVLIVAVVSGCSGATPTSVPSPPPAATPTPTPSSPPSPTTTPSQGATPVPPSAPAEAVSPFDDSAVGCSIGAVQVAETNVAPLTGLTGCQDPVQFAARVRSGGLVTTDPCGQAVLNSRCGTIYVFQDSGLRFSHCDQQTAFSAAGCVTDGTIAWNNTCPAGVATIVTPTASIALHGTWISATYLPDRQLSLFTVLEGEALATPLDATGTPSGGPQEIPRGSFWFSAPGNPATVGGLDPQVAHPLERFEPVIGELQLESWMAAVKARAEADGVQAAIPAKPVINVRARGGQLDDKVNQDALLLSVDWQGEVASSIPPEEVAIFGLIGARPPSNLALLSQDLETALRRIDQAKLGDTPIVLIADEMQDPDVVTLGKIYVASLEAVKLTVEYVILPPDDAARLYEERGSQTLPTIWLSTR